jgi:hypothetical protein
VLVLEKERIMVIRNCVALQNGHDFNLDTETFGAKITQSVSDCLLGGRSGNRNSVGARFSVPVQTGPEVQPASCTMVTGSFPGIRCGRGVTLTPHLLLVPRSKIEYN